MLNSINRDFFSNNHKIIFIPLIKRAENHDFNFDNYKYQQSSTTTTTQYINQPYYTKDVIPQEYLYNVTTDANINPTYNTSNQNKQNYYINSTKNIDISGAIPVSQGGNQGVPIQKKASGVVSNQNVKQNIINQNPSPYPITDTSQNNYVNYQFEDNKMGKVEENTNILKADKQKLKNDVERLMSETEKLKEENEVYKTDHSSLTKENDTLKETNDYYKNQLIEYEKKFKELQLKNGELTKINNDLEKEKTDLQEENNSLKEQITLLNKDVDAFENQNNQIRKMYEDLEKENENYKNQIEVLMKENETLKIQVQELNDNFILINKELEKIKNESNLVKNNFEKQKNNNNEETIKRLTDEINIYKQQAQENELLKKQIEEMKEQLQMFEERQEQERQELQKRQEMEEMQQRQELLQRQQRQELLQRQQRQLEEEEQEEEKEVKGEIIHDIRELEMLTKKINRDNNKKIIINLLYKASVDGDKASAFHEKCDEAQNTIVLVETKKGKRFGGFTTCSWNGNCVDKNDSQAFIFSFDKMKTYDNIPGDEAIGCYPKFGPIFLGCQIKIFDDAFTKGGTTFEKELNFNTTEDYELTDGERTFEVKDIEVYEVIIE